MPKSKYLIILLGLTGIFSCSVISEDDLDKFPEAYVKEITITNKGTGKKLTGAISYEGEFSSPDKVTITWNGDLRLFQIPIVVAEKTVKTIYEFSNGKVKKITNVNEGNVEARVEEFSYYSDGRLKKHTLAEVQEVGTFSYENDFYYDFGYNEENGFVAGGVTFVRQERCNATECYDAVFYRGTDGNYYGISPVEITSETVTGSQYYFTWDNEPENVCRYLTGGSNELHRKSAPSFSFYSQVPVLFDRYNSFGLPSNNYYDESEAQFFSINVEKGNAEYFLQLYYAIGAWILPPADNEYYSYNTEIYGYHNTHWIFPRLNMPTTYSNYVNSGFTFEEGREFSVQLTSEIKK